MNKKLEPEADGRLHLSGIAIVHHHLTEANRETLLTRAAHKSKRQIEELVAELSPKLDVPATMRKLPERRRKAKATRSGQLVPDRVAPNSEPEQNNREVETSASTRPAPSPARPAVVKPIAPARYKIEFTAGAELRDKLERLRPLMRSSVPNGDLATLIEVAVTEKLQRLESKRFGKTKAPRKSLEETDTSVSSRYIPAPVKRAVHERDQGCCTFVLENGRRCTETKRLEFHHVQPYGRGGDHTPENIYLLCRAHNVYLAEREYGKKVIERHMKNEHSSNRVSEPVAIYTFSNRATRTRRVGPAVPSVQEADGRNGRCRFG